jgi:hypothetical protein
LGHASPFRTQFESNSICCGANLPGGRHFIAVVIDRFDEQTFPRICGINRRSGFSTFNNGSTPRQIEPTFGFFARVALQSSSLLRFPAISDLNTATLFCRKIGNFVRGHAVG